MNLRLNTRGKAHPSLPIATAFLWAAACVIALAGCKSKSDNGTPSVSGAEAAASGEWLCDAGKATNDWDCIQSEDIEPILKERQARKVAPAPQPPEPITEDSLLDTLGQPALLPQNQPQIGPQGPQSSPVPPPRQPAAQPPTPPRASSSQNRDAPLTTPIPGDSQQPAYARLAYRPADPVRIIDLPEDFYAAQLLAVSTKEQIEDFVVEKDLYNMSAARIEQDGSILYVLLLGVYESKEIALSAVSQMPNDVRNLKPWVRPINGLQDAMMRADRLVSTADTR